MTSRLTGMEMLLLTAFRAAARRKTSATVQFTADANFVSCKASDGGYSCAKVDIEALYIMIPTARTLGSTIGVHCAI